MSGTIPTAVQGAYFWSNTPTVAASLDLQSALEEAAELLTDAEGAVQVAAATLSGLPITALGSTTPRALTARFAERLNPLDFGCVFDGQTPDTQGWLALVSRAQAILSSTSSAAVHIDVPAGTSICGAALSFAVTSSQRLSISGAGGRASSIIFTSHSAGISIAADPSSTVRVNGIGLNLSTGSAGSSSYALAITGLSSSRPGGTIHVRDVIVETTGSEQLAGAASALSALQVPLSTPATSTVTSIAESASPSQVAPLRPSRSTRRSSIARQRAGQTVSASTGQRRASS